MGSGIESGPFKPCQVGGSWFPGEPAGVMLLTQKATSHIARLHMAVGKILNNKRPTNARGKIKWKPEWNWKK